MGDDWYYMEDGVQRGPVTGDALQTMLDTGAISGEAPAWRAGMPDWLPASIALNQLESATAAPQVGTPLQGTKPKVTNGWLIAWQVMALLFAPAILVLQLTLPNLVPIALAVAAFVGTYVFVIGMFWRKKWALYGYLGLAVFQFAYLLYRAVAMMQFMSPVAVGLAFLLPLMCALGIALLLGALRLSGEDAGHGSFH